MYILFLTEIMHYVSLDFIVYCLLEVRGLSWELASAIAKRRLRFKKALDFLFEITFLH